MHLIAIIRQSQSRMKSQNKIEYFHLHDWRRDERVREVGSGRYGDEVAPGTVLAVHRLDELLQRVGIDLT